MPNVVTDPAGTLIGPLTTAWSLPKSCAINFAVCSTCSDLFAGQKCIDKVNTDDSGLQDNYECWPPRNTKNVATKEHPLMGWGFYSPGLACPTGFTSACTAIYGQRPDWEIQFPLKAGETAIGCCPEGFMCTNRFGNTCLAIATDKTKFPTATCDGTEMAGSVLATLTADKVVKTDASDSGQSSTVDRTYSLWAPMYQLNFQASDKSTATTAPKTGSSSEPAKSTASTTTSNDSTQTEPPASDAQNSSSSGGLSTGAAAGIGAGVAVAAIALIALVVFLLWRRRRRHREGTPTEGRPGEGRPEKYVSGSGYQRHEDGVSDWNNNNNFEMQPGHGGPRSELDETPYHDPAAFGRHYEPYKDGSPHSEIDGTPKPHHAGVRSEIDGTPKTVPAELSSDVPVELPTGR